VTTEQFNRWRDFAVRMARHGWPTMTRQRKDEIEQLCAGFFDGYCANSLEEIHDWDDPIGDWVDEYNEHLYWRGEARGERLAQKVRCCLRAGLGAAVEGGSGAGVLGFTVGTLRRMYGGTLPSWLAEQFTGGDMTTAPADMGVWL
jgi:hypothetical protein